MREELLSEGKGGAAEWLKGSNAGSKLYVHAGCCSILLLLYNRTGKGLHTESSSLLF